jgi:hypothetical protein
MGTVALVFTVGSPLVDLLLRSARYSESVHTWIASVYFHQHVRLAERVLDNTEKITIKSLDVIRESLQKIGEELQELKNRLPNPDQDSNSQPRQLPP